MGEMPFPDYVMRNREGGDIKDDSNRQKARGKHETRLMRLKRVTKALKHACTTRRGAKRREGRGGRRVAWKKKWVTTKAGPRIPGKTVGRTLKGKETNSRNSTHA